MIASLGSGTGGAVTTAGTNDASAIARAVTGISNGDTLTVGQRFTIDKNLSKAQLAHINSSDTRYDVNCCNRHADEGY